MRVDLEHYVRVAPMSQWAGWWIIIGIVLLASRFRHWSPLPHRRGAVTLFYGIEKWIETPGPEHVEVG